VTLFAYRAVTAAGEAVEGRLEALDKAAVVRRLNELGYLPIRAEPIKAGLSLVSAEVALPFLASGVTRKDVTLITRELATLMGARLPLDRALQLMIDLGAKGRVRSLLADILERIQRGGTLADALASHSAVFPGHYVSMVRAGEAGGSLDKVLAGVSDHLDKSGAMRETVRSALIYPVILLLMVGMTLVVMLTLVLPKFQRMFEDAGARLPFAALIVMRAGELFRGYGWWMLPLAALLLALLVRWRLRRPEGRLGVDRRVLRLPLIGSLVARIETARFARTMASLLGNGVDVLGAMTIVRETLTNIAMRRAVEDVSQRLKRGDGLAAPLRATGLWPPLALHLIQVGEETGELPAMLERIADIFEHEVAAGAARLLALLTPVLTLLTGAIVAAVVGAILSAILSVYSLPL
jgi:general secretion pathway protein F